MTSYENTVLVTGGTNGLGYYAALTIAKAQPTTQVVIASRTDKQKAAESINSKLKQSNVVFTALDLGDQTNIRSFTSQWIQDRHAPITALVLNAGLQFPKPEPVYTTDGIEKTFGVNHVGHVLLFHLLQSQLAPNCRIVVTASGVHDPAQKAPVPDANFTTVERLAHPVGDDAKANGVGRYSTSKLCNVLWTYALDKRIKALRKRDPSIKWTVTAMDPGLMLETSLAREYPWPFPWLSQNVLFRLSWLLRLIIGPNVHSAAESGDALARLAISNDVEGVTAKYYEGLKEIPSSEASYEDTKQDDLWEGTLNLIAKNDDERRTFDQLS